MATSSSNIVAELNKGLKLNGDNYDVWSLKIQYVLEFQETLVAINNVMDEPEAGNTAQHRSELAAYNNWKKADNLARITLMSALEDDILKEFKNHKRAKDLWVALRDRFGTYSTARVRSLTVKFDSYKKRPEHSMRTHIRQMGNMISELSDAGHMLTDEQQVQAVIRSLPSSWDLMKTTLTHNTQIRTLEDVRRHLELEEDRLQATKSLSELHMASSSKPRGGFKRKRVEKVQEQAGPSKKPKAESKPKQKKKVRVRAISKVKCFNCGQRGHYSKECTEPRRQVCLDAKTSELNVSSSVFLSESNPLWIVDSGATDHIARDRNAYVNFRRLPRGAKWIYVGNNTRVAVLGIGTCKLVMRDGRTLLLHDVLYAPQIRRNVVSVSALMLLGFRLCFHDNVFNLTKGSTLYGQGFISGGFIILDLDVYETSSSSLITSSRGLDSDMDVWHARLGHIGQQRMQRLANQNLLPGV